MRLDLDLLKNQLDRFAGNCKLTIEQIGVLADESSSVDDFKSRLDELCNRTIGETSLEVLAGLSVKLPESKNLSEPKPTEPGLQNELIEVKVKIDKLNDRDKSKQAESKV